MWALRDLNPGPTDYESAALTAELRARDHNLWLKQASNLAGITGESQWKNWGWRLNPAGIESCLMRIPGICCALL